MQGKKFKLGGKDVGMIFGLTAFRYWCEQTGKSLETLDDVVMGRGDMDNVVRNNYWALFIRCANQVYNVINNIDEESLPIEQFEHLIDITEQESFDKVFEYYLDSSYVGKTMREHYGLVEVSDKEDNKEKSTKKKRTQSAK